MRKKSHNIFSITQENDESIEEYMRRFREEKMETTNCSKEIETFRQGLLRNSDLFTDLTKTVPYTMEEAYGKAKKIVKLER